MPEKIEIGEQALRTRYNDEGQSLSEIADEFDCSIATVHNRMEEYGIPRESTQELSDIPSSVHTASKPKTSHGGNTRNGSDFSVITTVKENSWKRRGKREARTTGDGREKR